MIQAARLFWKKIVYKMQGGGFQLHKADPCMLYREDERGVCIIIIYIDDMLIFGKAEAIGAAIKVLQGHFQVKDPLSLEDYLVVQIVWSDDGKKAWLGQPTIIKSLEKQFGERVAKKKMTIMPGTPGFIGGKVDDISRWMRKHNPCTGQEWEHCCISPSTADLISRILQGSYPRVWMVPPWHMSQRCTG